MGDYEEELDMLRDLYELSRKFEKKLSLYLMLVGKILYQAGAIEEAPDE